MEITNYVRIYVHLIPLMLLLIGKGLTNMREWKFKTITNNAFNGMTGGYEKIVRTLNTRNSVECAYECLQEDPFGMCLGTHFDKATSTCTLWTQPTECVPYQQNGINDLTLDITVDNEFTVYADGALVGTDVAWEKDKKYTLPKYTHVLALNATNWGGPAGSPAGILASLSSGVMTDASWRCVESAAPDTDYPGWKEACYDDSAWETPNLLGKKGVNPWFNTGSTFINPSAQWIWTTGAADKILCRVSPHRCLLSSQPTPSADPTVACTSIAPALPDTLLGSGAGQYVRLGSVLWHICDDATRVGMRCDVDDQWEVVRMTHSHTII